MKKFLFFVSIFTIIFISFNMNVFKTYDNNLIQQLTYSNTPVWYDTDSQSLVIGSLLEYKVDGFMSGLGRLARVNMNSADWYDNIRSTYTFYFDLSKYQGQEFEQYYSQLGGQGLLFRVLEKLFTLLALDSSTKFLYFQLLTQALFVLLLTIIVYVLTLEFGKISGLLSLISILFSMWPILISMNLYWVVWTWFFPMVISIVYVSIFWKYNRKLYFRIYLLILFMALSYRASSGYEFISTILISAVIPYLYILIKHRIPIKKVLVDLSRISLTLVGSFFATIIAHFIYIGQSWNSYTGALEFMKFVILKRTHGNLLESFESAFPNFKDVLNVPIIDVLTTQLNSYVLIYEFQNSTLIIRIYHVIIVVLISLFILIFKALKSKNQNYRNKDIAAIISIFVSFLAPISWFVLAKGHTAAHPHLIPIIWYLPFIIFGAGFVGYTFSRILNLE